MKQPKNIIASIFYDGKAGEYSYARVSGFMLSVYAIVVTERLLRVIEYCIYNDKPLTDVLPAIITAFIGGTVGMGGSAVMNYMSNKKYSTGETYFADDAEDTTIPEEPVLDGSAKTSDFEE